MGYGLMDEIEGLREELKKAQLAYHLAAQMSQFKTGFLARTAHELRSPLSSLMGLHQLILSDLCESPQEEREFINQAYQSAQKLMNIIDEIITVSKIDYGTIELEIKPIQLATVFDELYHLTYLQAANRSLKLEIFSPHPNLYVMADFHQLLQVLLILLNTAINRLEPGKIKVLANLAESAKLIEIGIELNCRANFWSEPSDFLGKIPQTTPESLRAFAQELEMSSGMKFLLAQTLIEAMHGHLEIVEVPSDISGESLTRLQCSLPLALDKVV